MSTRLLKTVAFEAHHLMDVLYSIRVDGSTCRCHCDDGDSDHNVCLAIVSLGRPSSSVEEVLTTMKLFSLFPALRQC